VKRISPIRACERAHEGETRFFVEQRFAYDESRPASLLLMAGLWIEGDGDNVSPFSYLQCIPEV
jgi:hypothetical protein